MAGIECRDGSNSGTNKDQKKRNDQPLDQEVPWLVLACRFRSLGDRSIRFWPSSDSRLMSGSKDKGMTVVMNGDERNPEREPYWQTGPNN
ncbi:hypothetical protein Taro_046735 [Colocasia esculenta]|uniref:Uncharacterized protein n=1 Tax=Colocasia esculenta TaxID=4460 RepID=A0A843WUH3_COLES|nr:hypothetical protein [Colocasia esculenta]